ncbi:hypothetical protein ACIQM4_25050 [Streptomyces sp. NPDC091272]|uniref:hypothetical protein n=1 Tax=Streptomyces sp. NPDC091272 TaxID=3365981 RepID=UPI00382DCD11
MRLEALRHANFTSLTEAVRDWSVVVTRLKALEKDAGQGLGARARQADWAGVNADVTREFVAKTAGEFTDARAQASSIHNVLRDTRDELVKHRNDLTRAIERGQGKQLAVVGTADGGFSVRPNAPCRPSESEAARAAREERSARDVTALRDELQRILNAATESDSTADRVLRALVAQARLGFAGGPSYRDRDTAAGALKQADAMASLMGEGRALAPAQRAALLAGLKRYASHPLFAERFATQVGARGTLDFWADRARFEEDHELQKYLGLTLAEATRSDSPQMRQWERSMVALGDEPVSAGRREALGFQVMSNLLRWGEYDNEFLKSYGTELVRVEKELGENGRAAAEDIWDDSLPLNRSGTDAGHDPMTGFMQALSKSPEAATQFFNGTFLTPAEDHEFTEDTDGDGKEGRRTLSNFEYLFEERQWPITHHTDGTESFAGPDFMAHALEAAATGRPAGEPAGDRIIAHTPGQVRVMESLVSSISEDGKRVTDRGYMGDSVGRIAVDYLPDINRAIADDRFGNTDRLFPVTGAAATMEHPQVTRFLLQLGQTPEGYAQMQYGHKIYMGSLMDYHLNPDTPEGLRYPHTAEKTVTDISLRTAEISGTLTRGCQEAVLGSSRETDKDFSDALSNNKAAISGAAGIVTGAGVTFIASPIGGALAGGGASAVTGMVIEYVGQQIESEELKASGREAGDIWGRDRDAAIEVAQRAATMAAERHRTSHISAPADWAYAGADEGFNRAEENTSRMADDLTTEIAP